MEPPALLQNLASDEGGVASKRLSLLSMATGPCQEREESAAFRLWDCRQRFPKLFIRMRQTKTVQGEGSGFVGWG